MQGIDEVLGEFAIHMIISKLDPNDTARIVCVNKKFKSWASEDCFWSLHCANDLSLSSPVDPLGNPAPSFKATYQLWRETFSLYPWALVKRVKMCWDKLKSWLGSNFPEVLATLHRGTTEEELNETEKSLKVKLPLPTRLIYRMHNGQEFSDKLLGLIGGYSIYGHLVNVHMLTLGQVVRATRQVTRDLGFSRTSKYVTIAASRMGKVFFLNCSNMQLYVGTANLSEQGEMMPCVPTSLLKSSGDQQCDGLLLWLEEHSRRLESGMITVREEENLKSLCQFPEKPPLCTTAVTNGVQVRASAVLVPEQSDLQNSSFLFAYSIRMSLLPEGCTVHGMTFQSCQLYWRRWIIRENETIKHDVDGEAVIGKYPLLLPGEKEFVYQSCTTQQSTPGSIEGSFTFVPGRIWANRQSAARSKERKMRYIAELERKVQTLQTEATSMSAQLTLLQRDTNGLAAENSDLKIRLQTMEQQVHLQDALNDALKEEIQHLKLLTGQPISNGGTMMTFPASFGANQPFYPSSQAMNTLLTTQQFQQLQIHSQKQQHQYQQHQLHQLQQPQHLGEFKLRSSIPSPRDNVSDSKSSASKD